MENAVQTTEKPDCLLPNHEETIKEIWRTHASDTSEVRVYALLSHMEEIMNQANPLSNGFVQDVKKGNNSSLKPLPFIINKIFCEITTDCASNRNAHATTMSLLNTLSFYSWEAKVVLSLAALAMSCIQVFPEVFERTFNESHGLLLQLPNSLEPIPETLHIKMSELVQSSLNVAFFLSIQFQDIVRDSTSPALTEALTEAMECVPVTVYWTVRSVVACLSQIICLAMGYNGETLNMEPLGLKRLNEKIEEGFVCLWQQASRLKNKKREEQDLENKRKLQEKYTLEELFRNNQADNQEILQALIGAKGGIPLLVYYSTERKVLSQVHIDTLKGKQVLLLITELTADLNFLHNHEIATLRQIFKEKLQDPTRKESHFEIVWVPIPSSSEPEPNFKFDQLKSVMPWYAVAQPWAMDLKAINHIKKVWQFENSPLLVVLDAQGKVVHLNALHMVMLWGKMAFPFTADREESLWTKETWSLNFLVNGIDPLILQWVKEKKLICLYGGKDIELIRQFTTEAKRIANAEAMRLEMVYVGASNDRKRVRDIIRAICKENLSHSWKNLDSINHFWTRLQRMWVTRQNDPKPLNNDPKRQGLAKLLTLDGNGKGWALFCEASTEVATASGDIALKCLVNYNAWKEDAKRNGLLKVLKEQFQRLSPKGFNVEIIISEATIGHTAKMHPTATSNKVVVQKYAFRYIKNPNNIPPLRYGKVGMK